MYMERNDPSAHTNVVLIRENCPKNIYIHSVLKIVFESVQQKHLDKTIFDQQVMYFVQQKKQVSQICIVSIVFMSYEI